MPQHQGDTDELRSRATAKAQGKRGSAAKRDRTPREEADVEHRANLRELTRQAHGVNLDLCRALLKDLAAVAPEDMDVARFFAFGVGLSGTTERKVPVRHERLLGWARLSMVPGCRSSSCRMARWPRLVASVGFRRGRFWIGSSSWMTLTWS